jgi:hypothetical protein
MYAGSFLVIVFLTTYRLVMLQRALQASTRPSSRVGAGAP